MRPPQLAPDPAFAIGIVARVSLFGLALATWGCGDGEPTAVEAPLGEDPAPASVPDPLATSVPDRDSDSGAATDGNSGSQAAAVTDSDRNAELDVNPAFEGEPAAPPGSVDEVAMLLQQWGIASPSATACDASTSSNAERSLRTNLGSKAFTWLTSTVEQARYEPIGELANYFGFAALRIEIREGADDPLADEGVRGSSWRVVLENLDASQRSVLYETANAQHEPFFGFLDERVGLVDELWRLKDDESPSVADLDGFITAMGEYESEISIVSAAGYGEVIGMLSPDQASLFGDIRSGGAIVTELVGTGPYASEVDAEVEALSSEELDLLRETASKFLAYATGSVEDAVILPAGKIGNYFAFASYRYVDRADVSRSGAADLLWSVLNDEQETLICQLAQEGVALEQAYVDGREALIRGIYPLKSGQPVDEDALQATYLEGAIAEGRMGVASAYYFDQLERMLSAEQIQRLMTLRNGNVPEP